MPNPIYLKKCSPPIPLKSGSWRGGLSPLRRRRQHAVFHPAFLVLDVYAHYVERIPARMISANADSLATLQEMREEIGLLAKTIETRDVSITNHAEKTDELCRITLAKCNETIAGVELMVKNLGAQVDTKAIVRGVIAALNPASAGRSLNRSSSARKSWPTGDAHAGKHPGASATKPRANGQKGFGKPRGPPVWFGALGRQSFSPA
jgi:hypothetical protein